MIHKIFDENTGSRISVNEQLAEDLKTIFGQQIYLKWDYFLQRIKVLNIYYVS